MFSYSDPTGTGALAQIGALAAFQGLVNEFDQEYASLPGSAYVARTAFQSLPEGIVPQSNEVRWIAYPKTATVSNGEIDANRARWQDEYTEWHVETDATGKLTRITFTTEFATYYQALASVGSGTLVWAIQQVITGANPAPEELFGPLFAPDAASPQERGQRFLAHATANPWNNGEKGILFLMQPTNTLGALFDLLGQCAIPQPNVAPASVCPDGHCVAERNSDPRVCQAAQGLAQAGRALSVNDPVGVAIVNLGGIWKIDGKQVDINDAASNQGVWAVSRNGRRGVLDLSKSVTLGDDSVTSGAAVAAVLEVKAEVISAAEQDLPAWARTAKSSRVRE